MSDTPEGPGWRQSPDGKWHPPLVRQTEQFTTSSGKSRTGVLILVGVICVAVIGAVTAGVLVSRNGNSPYPAAALPSTTASTTDAVQAANEVRGCMQTHQMQYAQSEVQHYSGARPPFLQANPNISDSTDPIYSGSTPTVT